MTGIAGMESMVGPYRRRGRCFTLKLSVRFALIIGLIIVNVVRRRRDERRSGNAGCAGGGKGTSRTSQEQGIVPSDGCHTGAA